MATITQLHCDRCGEQITPGEGVFQGEASHKAYAKQPGKLLVKIVILRQGGPSDTPIKADLCPECIREVVKGTGENSVTSTTIACRGLMDKNRRENLEEPREVIDDGTR